MPKALDIFNRSEDLRTIYFLRSTPSGRIAAPSEAKAGHFLLWFAAFGRKRYQEVAFGSDLFDYITEPVGEYLTRLELFADMLHRPGSQSCAADMSSVHSWYYVYGIRELNLEIFVTPRELAALADIRASSDGNDSLSLLEKIRIELGRTSATSINAGEHNQASNVVQTGTDYEWAVLPSWLSMRANARASRSAGVNLIGYAHGVLGIGEDIRACARALGRAGVPFSILNVALPQAITPSATTDLSCFFVDRPIFPFNLFCMTLFETERMRVQFGSNVFGGRYNIGYWPWELPALSPLWHHAFNHVDEVWAISPYLVEVFSQYTEKPVTLMPPGVAIGPVESFDLSTLGIEPGSFVFLTMLDFNSFMARKNPIGAIDAFKRAFPRQNSSERLIIKTINGDTHSDDFDRLLTHVEEDPRILIVDGVYSRAIANGLIAAVDCLVSLHRAEGLGRTIAEAMLLETPVVATDWSGSTSLVDNSTGFPVRYALMPVSPGDYVFEQGCQWAEPSIDDAVEKLCAVRRKPDLAKRKCAKARSRIARDHGLDAVGARIANRLDQITSG